jgi:signal transduction histidine kinase
LTNEATMRPAADVEISCFRITQEALTNVARHAKATEVEVRLHMSRTQLDLIIRDNGVGFNIDVFHANRGLETTVGLSGMEERVRLAGGLMKIHSSPVTGTEVHASFPLNAAERG